MIELGLSQFFFFLRYVHAYFSAFRPLEGSITSRCLVNETASLSQTERRAAEIEADQFRFLGNCPPTPPLSHHFALSEK